MDASPDLDLTHVNTVIEFSKQAPEIAERLRAVGIKPKFITHLLTQIGDKIGLHLSRRLAKSDPRDHAALFIREWEAGGLPVPHARCRVGDLWSVYLAWADRRGVPTLNVREFGAVVRAHHPVFRCNVGSVIDVPAAGETLAMSLCRFGQAADTYRADYKRPGK